MKPIIKKAFDLVNQATGQLSGTREVHVKIQQALQLIQAELSKKEEKVEEKK